MLGNSADEFEVEEDQHSEQDSRDNSIEQFGDGGSEVEEDQHSEQDSRDNSIEQFEQLPASIARPTSELRFFVPVVDGGNPIDKFAVQQREDGLATGFTDDQLCYLAFVVQAMHWYRTGSKEIESAVDRTTVRKLGLASNHVHKNTWNQSAIALERQVWAVLDANNPAKLVKLKAGIVAFMDQISNARATKDGTFFDAIAPERNPFYQALDYLLDTYANDSSQDEDVFERQVGEQDDRLDAPENLDFGPLANNFRARAALPRLEALKIVQDAFLNRVHDIFAGIEHRAAAKGNTLPSPVEYSLQRVLQELDFLKGLSTDERIKQIDAMVHVDGNEEKTANRTAKKGTLYGLVHQRVKLAIRGGMEPSRDLSSLWLLSSSEQAKGLHAYNALMASVGEALGVYQAADNQEIAAVNTAETLARNVFGGR